jgi:hypothetical protein
MIFASGSRFVYVSSQVLVGCLTSCVGGENSLFGEGCGEYRDNEGAGDGFLEDGSIVPATLGSGDGRLLQLDGVRSCTGRGEMGTFQMTASSGSSSSSSLSHSASRSFRVLRFASCHDCLRELSDGEGRTSFRELFRDSVRGAEVNVELFAGDGDRDERCGAARLMELSEGADGDVRALLDIFPGAASCVGLFWARLVACPFRPGCLDLEVLVRSRTEWCAGCGCEGLRPPEEKDCEAS